MVYESFCSEMQPQKISRLDLAELKAHIVKKVGADKSKWYFYYLSRFLNQKLGKNEFDKLCFRVLGRENIPLHNRLIRSILRNACQAKPPPTVHPSGAPKSVAHATNKSPSRQDGHEPSVTNIQSQNQNAPIWSNGVLPVSPRKVRSGMRDRKLKDRPSPLGPNGKVDSVAHHQPTPTEDSGSKVEMENGTLSQCDYQRHIQHLQAVAELPETEIGDAIHRPAEKSRINDKGPTKISIVEDGEEVEQLNHLSFSRGSLTAPLGIPYCSASVGGSRKAVPVSSSGSFVSCCDSGSLPDTDTLRRRMDEIATVQGLDGVSIECANTLNIMVDVYLKRLIRSCVDLAGARSTNQSRKPSVPKQIQGKVINGMWPNNHSHLQSIVRPVEPEPENRPPCSVSLHDFNIAMQLNPRQLGEDWPLLLEKISMQSFER